MYRRGTCFLILHGTSFFKLLIYSILQNPPTSPTRAPLPTNKWITAANNHHRDRPAEVDSGGGGGGGGAGEGGGSAAGEEKRGEAARPATPVPENAGNAGKKTPDKKPTFPPPIDPNLLPDNFPWPYFK